MDWLQKVLEFDKNLFLTLNSYHSDYWDTVMLLITRKETWFPFFAILLFYFIRNYRAKSWLIIGALAVLILLSDQLSGLMKETFQRWRPVHDPIIGPLVHNVLRKGGFYGFVSSHAANSVAIWIFTSRIFKNRAYSVLLLLWTVVFSYSRIYSGVHYPLDILGGALLGWGVGTLVYRLLMFVETHFFFTRSPRIEKISLTETEVAVVGLVFAVVSCSMLIISYLLHHYHYL